MVIVHVSDLLAMLGLTGLFCALIGSIDCGYEWREALLTGGLSFTALVGAWLLRRGDSQHD